MSESPVSPELAALARQVAQLEAEREQLRRSLVQQLNATNKVTRRLLTLDQEHFAGRHQTADDVVNPAQDLQVAEQIVDALAQELVVAERSRRQSEAALTHHLEEHSTQRIANGVLDELTAKDQELTNFRRQALTDQEAAAAEIRQVRQDAHDQLVRARDELNQLRAHLAAAEETIGQERELRRCDQAEALSLIAEIVSLAGADRLLRDHDEATIPLGLLEDSLRQRQTVDLGTVVSAAESVLSVWARLASARSTVSQQVLSQDGQSISREVVEAKILIQTARAEAETERKLRQEAATAEAVRAAHQQVREADLAAARDAARDEIRQEFTGLLQTARAAVRSAREQTLAKTQAG